MKDEQPSRPLLIDIAMGGHGAQAIKEVMTRFFSNRGVRTELLDPERGGELDSPILIGGGDVIHAPGDPYYDKFRLEGSHILNAAGTTTSLSLDFLKNYKYLSVRTSADRDRLATVIDREIEVVPCVSTALPAARHSPAALRNLILIHLTHNAITQCAGIPRAFENFNGKEIRWIPVGSALPESGAMLKIGIDLGWVPDVVAVDSTQKLLAIIGSARAVVASSYYAAQFAHQQNTPFIAYARDPAVRAFLHDRNLGELGFYSARDLADKLEWILKTPPDFTRTIESDRAALKNHFSKLAHLLDLSESPITDVEDEVETTDESTAARIHTQIDTHFAIRKYKELAERGAHYARAARHWRDELEKVRSRPTMTSLPPTSVSVQQEAPWEVERSVLFVLHQFFPYFPTGVERATQNLAIQLRKLGWGTTVLSAPPLDHSNEEPATYSYEGTEVLQPRPARLTDPIPPAHFHEPTANLIRETIQSVRPQVMHLMHAMYYPEAPGVAREMGIPVLIHLHDYWFACPRINALRLDGSICENSEKGLYCSNICRVGAPEGGDRHFWAAKELEVADSVIVPTNFVKEFFASHGFQTDDWIVVQAGVDYSKLNSTHHADAESTADECTSPMRVRFLGTCLRHKAPHLLIRAVREIPDAELAVSIHGHCYHETDYMEQLRSDAAGDERISFEGMYSHEELGQLLDQSDLVVVPSVWNETQSLIVLSALAAGVPVVASDLGGMAEIIRVSGGGYLFPAGDPVELARILHDCAKNRDTLTELRSKIIKPEPIEHEAFLIERLYTSISR